MLVIKTSDKGITAELIKYNNSKKQRQGEDRMTAIEAIKKELKKIQQAQHDCCTESGFVKNECKYRHIELVRKARAFKEAIDWMEALYANK